MAKVTVGLPQGTRDFGPEIVRKRNYILDTIRSVFELYGFQPLETPAMENLETLMGKYGDEGDKLIFKILNNGLNDPKNREKAKAAFDNLLAGRNDKNITERALRYDLTIPFARYVAMNHTQLTMPFKRYQVQPVWRADRPQKGRYREFYQCDADVVGSNSLMNEVELALIYLSAFSKLKVPVELKINNRKILTALAELSGCVEKMADITIAIDKLDKIGPEKVREELTQRGLASHQINTIEKYLSIATAQADNLSNDTILEKLKDFFGDNITGRQGIAEIEFILERADNFIEKNIFVDVTLARGLNYYTGTIFEVKAKNVNIGSIGGGGRYNDLTGLFGVPDIPGVGISFGVDRIYDVMDELKLFPEDVYTGTQVLFFNLGEDESAQAFLQMQQLRNRGIRCELYHETAKMDRQFKYAEKKNIPTIIIIGSRELEMKNCVVKNLQSGDQQTIPVGQLTDLSF